VPRTDSSPRPATIREVAVRAGVSTATVSRSLRGGVGVEPATKARVEEAARELRYRPSGVARSLKLRTTSTIGLIVTDIENPYFPQIVSAVEDAAHERGYTVLLADGRRDPERELASLDLLGEREVDGLIIASSALTLRHRERIREVPCPVVIINSESTVAAVPAVMADNEMGGWLAAEHVIGLGHRHLVFVGDPDDSNSAVQARINGARSAMTRRGFEGPEALHHVGADGAVEGGIRAAAAILEAAPGTTAVLCRNDLTAIGVIRGLQEHGRRVPDDISVVGFDDIEVASYVDPALTTVRQSTDEMARWAVESLFGRIASGPEPSAGETAGEPGHTRRVPVELIERESSGPVSPRSDQRP
jgi:LacI family transcriptional regulator